MSGLGANLKSIRTSFWDTVVGKEKHEDGDQSKVQEVTTKEEKERESIIRSEGTILAILNAARAKFIDRRIVGGITISTTLFGMGSSVNCRITEDDIRSAERVEAPLTISIDCDNPPAPVDGDVDSQLSYTFRIAVEGMDLILKTLEWRASAYENVPYSVNVDLSRSSTFSPPLPIAIFSVTIAFSANANTLIQSRNRRKALRAANDLKKKVLHELEKKGYTRVQIQDAIEGIERTSGICAVNAENVASEIINKKGT